MNKLKKKVATLKTYLNKDGKGLKLLDDVVRECTAKHKAHQATQQELENAQKTIDLLRVKVKEAESLQTQAEKITAEKVKGTQALHTTIKQRDEEILRLSQRITKLETIEELALLGKPKDPLTARAIETFDLKAYIKTFYSLREKMPQIPTQQWHIPLPKEESVLEFDLCDITRSPFSEAGQIKLGQFVAILAGGGMPILIHTNCNVLEFTHKVRPVSESFFSKVLKWVKPLGFASRKQHG